MSINHTKKTEHIIKLAIGHNGELSEELINVIRAGLKNYSDGTPYYNESPDRVAPIHVPKGASFSFGQESGWPDSGYVIQITWEE
jgi:hypothetical protein